MGSSAQSMDAFADRLELAYPDAGRGLLLSVLENSNGDEGVCMVFLAEMLGPPKSTVAAASGGQQSSGNLSGGLQQGLMDYSQSVSTPRVMGAVVGNGPAQNPIPSGHNKALQNAMRRQNEELSTAQRQVLECNEKAKVDRKRISELEKKLRDLQGAEPSSSPAQSHAAGEFTSSLLDMGLNMDLPAAEPNQQPSSALEERLVSVEQQLADERAVSDQLRVNLTGAQARVNSETEQLRRELQQKNLALEDAFDQVRILQGELDTKQAPAPAAPAPAAPAPAPAPDLTSVEDSVEDFFGGN